MKLTKNQKGFSHLVLFLAIVLISVVALSGYRVYSAGEDKDYFERLDGRISALSFKTMSKFGAAEKILNAKVCEGAMTCGVAYAYYYKGYLSDNSNKEKLAKLENAMSGALVGHGYEPRFPASGTLPYGYGDPHSRFGICQINSDYFKMDEAPENLVWEEASGIADDSKPSPGDMRVTIYCHAKSRGAYY